MTRRAESARVRIGTAGWSLPQALRERFPPGASLLERYAKIFTCVEIDSSFHRSHRHSTYERWSESVPGHFAFALKLPKTITHQRRLAACKEDLERFQGESAGLGEKRAILLVQLPPSFAFDSALAGSFFELLRVRDAGLVACEPRHPTWFLPDAEALLGSFEVARVAADPAPAARAASPGGWRGFAYYRWHGLLARVTQRTTKERYEGSRRASPDNRVRRGASSTIRQAELRRRMRCSSPASCKAFAHRQPSFSIRASAAVASRGTRLSPYAYCPGAFGKGATLHLNPCDAND